LGFECAFRYKYPGPAYFGQEVENRRIGRWADNACGCHLLPLAARHKLLKALPLSPRSASQSTADLQKSALNPIRALLGNLEASVRSAAQHCVRTVADLIEAGLNEAAGRFAGDAMGFV
jgi:hypothetical protein